MPRVPPKWPLEAIAECCLRTDERTTLPGLWRGLDAPGRPHQTLVIATSASGGTKARVQPSNVPKNTAR